MFFILSIYFLPKINKTIAKIINLQTGLFIICDKKYSDFISICNIDRTKNIIKNAIKKSKFEFIDFCFIIQNNLWLNYIKN